MAAGAQSDKIVGSGEMLVEKLSSLLSAVTEVARSGSAVLTVALPHRRVA